MDPVLATPGPRHLGHQFTAVLEKVQMPPAPFDRVVDPTLLATQRTVEVLGAQVFDSQFQPLGLALKATFHHLPLLTQSQRRTKKFFRCHACYFATDSTMTQNANPAFVSLLSKGAFAL